MRRVHYGCNLILLPIVLHCLLQELIRYFGILLGLILNALRCIRRAREWLTTSQETLCKCLICVAFPPIVSWIILFWNSALNVNLIQFMFFLMTFHVLNSFVSSFLTKKQQRLTGNLSLVFFFISFAVCNYT